MKTYLKILSLLCLLGVTSCKQDFVEVTDPNSLSGENFPSTMAHLDQMRNGLYGTQHAFGLFGHNMLGKNIYMWDHTADLAWQGTPTWIAMAQNNTLPNDEFLRDTWRDAWKGVQRANTLMAGIKKMRLTATQPADLAGLDLMEGEAHFLRAWFYYYLVSFWGETFIVNGQGGDRAGVPIITEVPNNLVSSQVGRATVRENWDFIIGDLKTAEALLAGKNWTGDQDKHRAGIWAIKGFLGKAYLFSEDLGNARTYLKDVIDNSGKRLVAFDEYKDMFNGKNEFNAESLFEVNVNVDKNTWGAWNDASMGSGVAMIISPFFTNAEGGSSASGWGNVFAHEKNLGRFGFNEPHYFKPGTSAVNPANVDPAYIARSVQLRQNKAADPRLWVSLLQPYADSMKVDDKKTPIAHYGDGVELTMQAWSLRKYVNLDGNEYSINVNNGSNFYWLRLADVYLMYAETLLRAGDASGLEYVNKVKRRAYGYPVDAPSPVDYQSVSAQTMAGDPVLKNDPLKYERWAELFGEGSWWMDVCRWRIGDREAAYYQKVRGGAIQWSDTDYAQPIPQAEREANAKIGQNPGY